MWERTESVHLPTTFGFFEMIVYLNLETKEEYSVVYKGSWKANDQVLTRVHSSCLTGDVFASKRCDCGPQLHTTLEMIEKVGQGLVIYMPHEGRGIGLFNKMRAYKLQEMGRDTVEANLELGFAEDDRDFSFAGVILKDLGINRIRLVTNNPLKVQKLSEIGVIISEQLHLDEMVNSHNRDYLNTKVQKMGHVFRSFKTEN